MKKKFKKIIASFTAIAMAIWSLGLPLASLLPNITNVAHAATFGINDLTVQNQTLGAAATLPIFKITFGSTTAGQTLTNIKLSLESLYGATFTGSAVTSNVLADLAVGNTSGIALYKDDGGAGIQGSFDAQDDVVTLASSPVYGTNEFTITPADPASNPGSLTDGGIFFVVLKSKAAGDLTAGHKFRAKINANGDIVTSGTDPTVSPMMTQEITIDKTGFTVTSVETNTSSGALAAGNKVTITFSERMKTTTVTATTLDSLLTLNNTTGTGNWGTSPSVAWSNDGTQLQITLGTTPDTMTPGTASTTDPTITFDNAVTDLAGNSWLSHNNDNHVIKFATAPTLSSKQGSQMGIVLTFSKNIMDSNGNSYATSQPFNDSNFSYTDASGGGLTICWAGSVFSNGSAQQNKIQIGLCPPQGGQMDNPAVGDSITLNTTIKDYSGNAYAGTSTLTLQSGEIDVTPPTMVTNVSLVDNDTNNGIDGRDLTVSWTAATTDSTFGHYEIFIVPASVIFDPWSYMPIWQDKFTGHDFMTQGSGTVTITGTADLRNYSNTMGSQTSGTTDLTGGSYKAYVVCVDNLMNRSSAAGSNPATIKSDIPISSGSVIINEVMWGGTSTSTADEYIELYNPTTADIDLAGWVLENGWASANMPIGQCTGNCIIESGTYFLISNFDATGSKINIAPDIATTSLDLADTNNGNLILKTGPGGTTIDSALAGATGWASGDGGNPKKSMERKNPPGNGLTATQWATSTAAVNLDSGATDKGTPKEKNSGASDTVAPTVVSASATLSSNSIQVIFSEPVATTTANIAGNYALTNSLAVAAAEIDYANDPTGKNVRLFLGLTNNVQQTIPNAQITVTVTGVKDWANNTISGSNTVAFYPTQNANSDTTAPVVDHMPVGWGWATDDIDFLARVEDSSGIKNVRLYYKGETAPTYTQVDMSALEGGFYRYTFDSSALGFDNENIKYYIKAEDNAGNMETMPWDIRMGNDFPFFAARKNNTAAGVTVTGTVKNTSNTALQGAIVAIPGLARTVAATNGSGVFSMSNVPAGFFDIAAIANGYMPTMRFGVNANSTIDVGTITLTSATGDTANPPSVLYTGPKNGDQYVPTDLWEIFIKFSEPIKPSTITTDNIKLLKNGTTEVTSTVEYNSFNSEARLRPSTHLDPSSSYTIRVTTSVTDISSAALSSTFNATFTTGEMYSSTQTGGGMYVNNTVPFVKSTYPAPGMNNIPKNAKIVVSFSRPMDDTTLTSANIKIYPASLGISSAIGWSGSLDTASTTFTITPSSALTSSIDYEMKISTGCKDMDANSIGGPGGGDFFVRFTTSSVTDTTLPTIKGTFPQNSATGIRLNTNDINFSFSKPMSPSTIVDTDLSDGGNITFKVGASNVAGKIEYDTNANMAHLIPSVILQANTTYAIQITTSVKDMNNNAVDGNKDGIADAYSFSFTTEATNSDTTPPEVMFANADTFNLAVTYSEAMDAGSSSGTFSVTNPSNYTLYSPWDAANSSGTQLNLTGKTIIWDGPANTAKIQGLSLNPNATFKVKVANVKDLSTQPISSGANWGTGTVMDNSTTKGMLGPGQMTGPMDMGMKGMGMMAGAWPMSQIAGKTTNYFVDIPLQKQLPLGGKIILTFPQGFDITNAAQMATSTGESSANNDINGPGSGAVYISSLSANQSSRTITITIAGSATNSVANPSGFMDFLHFDLKNIVNSTVPKGFGTDGYTVDVKTKDTSNLILESLVTAPIFITDAGTLMIRGTVKVGATGLNGVKVYLGSPMTGPMDATTANQDCGSGAVDGCYIFNNLPQGDSQVWINPLITVSNVEYKGMSIPEPIWLTSANSPFAKNFSVTSNATALKIAGTITGPANEKIMVWTGNPQKGQFFNKEYTIGGGGTVSYSISVEAGEWDLGVDPWRPTGPMMMGPPPEANFMPPQPKRLNVVASSTETSVIDYNNSSAETIVTNATGAVAAGNGINFTLSTASQRIKGYVVDGSNNPIPNAEVFGYKPGGMGGMGAHTQTKNDGSFDLKVSTGLYTIGAAVPGMPPTPEKGADVQSNSSNTDGNTSADVYSNGALIVDANNSLSTATNPLKLVINKSSNTISGKVTDTSGITISNASVWAHQENTPNNNRTFTGTDGNYTLYVSTGTWIVEADAPGYGYLGQKSVIVSSSNPNPDGNNFTPSSNLGQISGTISGLTATTSAMVSINGNSTHLNLPVNSSGEYLAKLPYNTTGSSTYEVYAWTPETGNLGKTTTEISNDYLGATTTVVNFSNSASDFKTITVNITDSTDAAYKASKAFIDIWDNTNTRGQHIDIKNNNTGSIKLKNGTYNLNVFLPGVPDTNLTITGAGGSYNSSNRNLTVDGNETITVKLPALKTITGQVLYNSSGASQAFVWVDGIDGNGNFTGVHAGTETDNSGNFTAYLPTGTFMMGCDKPGYTVSKPQKITITANQSGLSFTLTKNTLSISGRIWTDTNSNGSYDSGEGLSNAWIWGEKKGGGWAGTETDTNGSYNLSVSSGIWLIHAVSEKYQEVQYGSDVDSTASPSNINIQLTSAVTIKNSKSMPVVPSQGGTVDDSTNTGVKITLPANALGNDSNAGQVMVKEKNNVPQTENKKPFGNKAKEISVTDSNGQAVTNLNSNIEVEINLTKTEVDTAIATGNYVAADIAKVQNSYWDDTSNNWVGIETVKTVSANDGTGTSTIDFTTFTDNIDASDGDGSASYYQSYTISLKSSTDHLTDFAPTIPTDPAAPDTPAGLAGETNNNYITLNWTANSESDMASYKIYRSTDGGTTYPYLTTITHPTHTYTNTSLSYSTTYRYKISSVDTSNNESAASSAVAVTTGAASSSNPSGGAILPQTLTQPQNQETATTTQKTTEIKTQETTQEEKTSQETTTQKIVSRADKIVQILSEAKTAILSKIQGLLDLLGVSRDTKNEGKIAKKLVQPLFKKVKNATKESQDATTNFITYGTPTTKTLGEGERAGVVNSFQNAFNRLPANDTDWQDAVKIANGRFPAQQSVSREKEALKVFGKIYKRMPDFKNPNDNASLKIIAYGIRPTERNTNSEKFAINVFKSIFGKSPSSTTDWDIMRAITYSGAKR